MPTYVLLSTLTPEGRQTLHKDPDRLEAVNKESSPAYLPSVYGVGQARRRVRLDDGTEAPDTVLITSCLLRSSESSPTSVVRLSRSMQSSGNATSSLRSRLPTMKPSLICRSTSGRGEP
jgi:hypothetical protein